MELPWSTIDMDFMNLNQAAHGDREFGYIQSRLGVARKTVAGHVDSPVVAGRVALWARAALGRHELAHLRLARFGDNMRDVAVTEGDKVEAQLRFGVSVNTYGVNDLVAVVDEVADSDVDKLVQEYVDTYAVAAELLPVSCAVWEPRPSLSTSAEAWLMAGAPHHTVLSKAIGVEVLEDFAEMCGVEMVTIDDDTTTRGFKRELRWNAAYHRLAQHL
jgi:L-arabinose isomerase